MRIERLHDRHLGELVEIEADLFGRERWSVGMFRSELTSGHYYLVALADSEPDEVLGYAGVALLPPDEAWVNNMAVRRDAQRQGVGRALLTALLAEVGRHRIPRTLLEVATDNTAAQQLYAGFGFEPVAVRRRYYQPSNKDALVMMREE